MGVFVIRINLKRWWNSPHHNLLWGSLRRHCRDRQPAVKIYKMIEHSLQACSFSKFPTQAFSKAYSSSKTPSPIMTCIQSYLGEIALSNYFWWFDGDEKTVHNVSCYFFQQGEMRWGGRENDVITPFVEYLKHSNIDSVLIGIQGQEWRIGLGIRRSISVSCWYLKGCARSFGFY